MSSSVEVAEIPNCDFCSLTGKGTPAAVDGATRYGSWANMCDSHFEEHGIGLGTGRGQRLVLRSQDQDPEEFPLDSADATVRLDQEADKRRHAPGLAQVVADEMGLDPSEVDLGTWADDGGAVG